MLVLKPVVVFKISRLWKIGNRLLLWQMVYEEEGTYKLETDFAIYFCNIVFANFK